MMLEIEPIPPITLAQLLETRKQIRARLASPAPSAKTSFRLEPPQEHSSDEDSACPGISPPPSPAPDTGIAAAASPDPSETAADSGNSGAPLTGRTIIRKVAAFYGLSVASITSHNRRKHFMRPRHIACYLAKEITSSSDCQIGRLLGGYDRTSVSHAIRKIERLRQTDEHFANDMIDLRGRLRARHGE